MKLRKMITVSAAALMLAGVGASATNAGAPVHASRRTVRVSRQLSHKKSGLERQIRSDRYQVKQINREMARLNHKNVRKGKCTKKTVKRHKRTKKAGKKRNAKKITRHRIKRNRKSVKKTKKNSANQKTKTMTRRINVSVNNNVYTVDVKSNGKTAQIIPGTQKYVSSMKAYTQKYTKPFLANRSAMQANLAAFKKTHNMNNYVAAAKAYQNLNSMRVMPLKANNQSARK